MKIEIDVLHYSLVLTSEGLDEFNQLTDIADSLSDGSYTLDIKNRTLAIEIYDPEDCY